MKTIPQMQFNRYENNNSEGSGDVSKEKVDEEY